MPRKAKDKLIDEQELNNEIVEKVDTKTTEIAKVAKISRSTTRTSKAPKTTKTIKTTESSEASKTARATEGTRATKTAKATETAKTTKTAKSTKATKSTKTTTASKATKTTRKSSANSSKVATKTTARKPRSKKVVVGEYYDLPTNYNETIVKILAQTPTILFVYWDISEEDKQNLIKQFGENFFMATSPFLVIKNRTKNYEFEVEVNDYANSWYLHIPDSDCQYEVTLIRKAKNFITNSPMNYVTIRSSNELQTPNDHILFERLSKTVFFLDVKSKMIQKKNISSFAFMHNMGRIYHIYDLYKEMYQNELKGDELGTSLSSSQFSSTFK